MRPAANGGRRARSALAPWIIWLPSALFFCYAFFQRTSPAVMTEELMRDFAVSAALLGNLAAFYFYSYASVQLVVGVTHDRFGPRRVLAAAALVCALGSFMFARAESLEMAYAGRLLIGLGAAFGWIGALRLIADWFPPHRFAMVAGLTAMFGMAGAIGGQAPLAYLLELLTWREVMLAAAGAALVLALLAGLLMRDRRAEVSPAGVPAEPPPGPLTALRRAANRQTLLVAAYAGLNVGPFLAIASLWGVPYLMQARGLTRNEAALAVSAMLIGQGLSAPVLGWISDRLGRRKPVMLACSLLQLAAVCALVYLPGLASWAIHALMFLTGIGGTGLIIAFAMGREANPVAVAGSAAGIINTSMIGISALSQPLIGVLLDALWDGTMAGGIRVYDAGAYRLALLLFPAMLVLSMAAALAARETSPGKRA